MALRNKMIAGGLAALALVATSAAASAAPAYATANVNVRSGPGTYYGVTDTLRRGEPVDVRQCQGTWCYVQKNGPDGWVSSSYLARGGAPDYNDGDYWEQPRPPQYHPRPPQYPRPSHWNPRPSHHGYPAYQDYPDYSDYPDNSGASVCIDGPQGYFCVGN